MINIKKTSAFLFLVLLLGSCGDQSSSVQSSLAASSSAAASSLSAENSSFISSPAISSASDILTIGKVIDQVTYTAQKYNPYITSSELLKKSNLTEADKLTNTNAYILLYNAFKDTLGEYVGARVYESYSATGTKNVPEKAKSAFDFFTSHGLYVPYADNDFKGDTVLKLAHFTTILNRFNSYNGTSLKDDYYSTINHDDLYRDGSRASWTASDSKSYSRIVDYNAIVSWCNNILEDGDETNADLIAAKNFISAYSDDATRDDKTKGILKVVSDISECADETALMNKVVSLTLSQRFDPLFETQKINEVLEEDKQTAMGYTIASADFMKLSDNPYDKGVARDGCISQKSGFFRNLGLAKDTALAYATAYADLINLSLKEATALSSQKTWPETLKIDSSLNFGTSFNLLAHMKEAGFTNITQTGTYAPAVLSSPLWTTACFNSLFGANSSLDMKKAYVILMETNHYMTALPYDAMQMYTFATEDKAMMLEPVAYYLYLLPYISDSLCSYFYKTDDYKKDVEVTKNYLVKILETLKERIKVSSWLSAEGKASALKKVENMTYATLLDVCDGTNLVRPTRNYKSSSEGATLYDNIVVFDTAYEKMNLPYLGEKESLQSLEAMFMSLTANAFYSPDSNSFIIMMGYMAGAEKNYKDLTPMEVAGLIGWVCTHEISHGFDSNGTDFDENGKYNTSWLGEADRAAFEKIKTKVKSIYTDAEVMPGFSLPAEQTLAESIADIGGVELNYYTAMKDAAFTSESFFKECAKHFFAATTQAAFFVANYKDVHPYGRVRVNCAFSSFAPFQEMLKTEPRDFMYVAPDARVEMW